MNYTMYGSPSASGDNVVLALHALTGNSRVAEWWPGIVGPNALFDPNHWCIIGLDIPGVTLSLSKGPGVTLSLSKGDVTSLVRAQQQALDELGIERLAIVIGGSLGGMQALQWALDAPERVGHAIVVGAHDHHSTMGVALNAIQRECIALDPVRGLGTARKLAMLTYKSEALLTERHDRRADRRDPSRFDIEGYLDHQAEKFLARMDPDTYAYRTHLMDSFDVRDRTAPPGVELTFVGISSDWLFRPQDVRAAAERFNARYLELESDHGHDAFLAAPEALRHLLTPLVAPRPPVSP
ncbi:MAG: alpha/beta fold hydrolase [bacterium]|nr:alpha/beta fold hydrolase [bacterium]